MKPTRVLAAAAVLALLGVALSDILGNERVTPRQVLDRTRISFADKGSDRRLLLRDLDRALEDPRSANDRPLIQEVLLLRSELHESMNDFSSAMGEIQHVLEFYRPGDRDLQLRLALLEADSGQPAAALDRVTRLAAQATPDPSTLRIIGGLEATLAEQTSAKAAQALASVLFGADAASAQAALAGLCAMDPSDDRRPSLSDTLRLAIPTGEGELVKILLDQAEASSERSAAARSALSGALQLDDNSETLSVLMDLFLRANQPDLASELAQAAGLIPHLATDPGILHSSLTALLAADRLDAAVERINDWRWREVPTPASTCTLALSVLLERGDWRHFASVSNALRATQEPGSGQNAQFYLALQTTDRAEKANEEKLWVQALNRWNDVIPLLRKYVDVPGAVPLAHIQRAKSHRALGSRELEREDLLMAMPQARTKKEAGWSRFVSADDYMRLADLSMEVRNTGYRGPEERWTMAMSMEPERWEELAPKWKTLGEASLLQGVGYTFAEVYAAAHSSGRSIPPMDVGPQTLHEVGLEHLRRGTTDGAMIVARRLLGEYPGLVPAHDLLIEAQLNRGSRVQVMSDLLTRVALTGPDSRSAEFLEQIGPDVIRADQLLELMRLDPAGTGLLAVVHYALEHEDPQVALLALGSPPPEGTGEDALHGVLRAEAQLMLGNTAYVAPPLAGLEAGSELSFRAQSLEFRAACSGAAPEPSSTKLIGSLQDLGATISHVEATRELVLWGADELMARGFLFEAGILIRSLDGRVETRSGSVLEALTIHALLSGQLDQANEALERCEAFFGDGRVELRKLSLAVQRADWRAIVPLSLEARSVLGDGVAPWLEAALLLLEERHQAASELAREALAKDPHSPEWSLLEAAAAELSSTPEGDPALAGAQSPEQTRMTLRGAGGEGIDPREVIGLLIGINHAGLHLTAPHSCADLRERGAGDLWPGWIEALAAKRQGNFSKALETYSKLADQFPGFSPAWNGSEASILERDGRAWNPARIRIRAGRHQAGASLPSPSVAWSLDKACSLALAGELVEALDEMESLLEGSPYSDQRLANSLAAYLYLKKGDRLGGLAALERALPPAGDQSNSPMVESLVQQLIECTEPKGKAGPVMPMGEAQAMLLSLIERFPRNPLPALAWCRLKAQVEKRNPALISEVVTRTFESLRQRTKGKTLERLREGAADEWARFLGQYAPAAVETFLLQDLASEPGNARLWHLLARTVELQGRVQDAGTLYQAVATMTNSPSVRLDRAWFLLMNGGAPSVIEEELELARNAGPEAEVDPDQLAFVAAAMQLRIVHKPTISSVVGSLRRLWPDRYELANVSPSHLGVAYSAGLLRRGAKGDAETLTAVLNELKGRREHDPYTADLAQGLEHLQVMIPSKAKGRDRSGKGAPEDPDEGVKGRPRTTGETGEDQ